jgi:HAD superfamily hydrolase (TIGR01549 family)
LPIAVLFDIDGTLVTFEFDVEGTRKALIAELSRQGLDVSGLSLSTPTQQIVDFARRQAEAGESGTDFRLLRRRLYSILDESEVKSARNASVFPGTKKTLLYLRNRSVRLGVLTNSGRKAADEVLAKGRLLDCFDFVLTREDVDSMKPSPEGVLKAVQMFSLPKEQVYYVGDGILDIIAAKKAGLRIISVATGMYPPDRLRADGADFVVSSLRELPSLLKL